MAVSASPVNVIGRGYSCPIVGPWIYSCEMFEFAKVRVRKNYSPYHLEMMSVASPPFSVLVLFPDYISGVYIIFSTYVAVPDYYLLFRHAFRAHH